jgi:hypothetical protein
MCDGVHDACPPDGFQSATEQCRGTFGICDAPEFCTGTSALCPADDYLSEAVICRAVDGVCDVPERCTGVSPLCPSDTYASGPLCRGAADICDVPEFCDGASPDCPTDAFVSVAETCRSSAGVCDAPEHCTGTSAACPTDEFQPDTVTCRDADGICDVPELCTGTNAFCPDNQFAYGTECRESAGICDTPEFCGGASPDCPTDEFQPDTVTCRDADGICDVPELCTGINVYCPDDALAATGTLCRASTGACDPEEVCDGASAFCPADINDICTACGVKFYDLDLDREAGEEEARIEGWEVTLTGPAGELTTTTDEDGVWSFEDLPAGDYLICESEPLEGNWLVTTPPEGCFELAIPSSAAENCELDFGNVCLNGGGARSAGFWSNRNGMTAFLGTDRGASALTMLVSLHLVDGYGDAFDPDNYGRFKEWLMRRSARNMAYQLSAQLAATALNVAKLGVDPARFVWVPGAIGADELGFLTIERLMREVDAELHAHPYTPEGDPARAYQDVLTRGLDHLNNNMNFLSLEPCDFNFEAPMP